MRTSFFILLLSFCLPNWLCGQGVVLQSSIEPAPKAYFFNNYTTRDGLPHGLVAQIFEDSRGFIWIASQTGLARYDGFAFTPILGEGSEKTSPATISSIAEDSAQQIWATAKGLLLRLDGLSNDVAFFPCDSLGAKLGIVRAERGRLLLSTNMGLFWYQIRENKFVKMPLGNPVFGNEAARVWGIPKTGELGAFAFDGKGGFWLTGQNDKASGLYHWEMVANRWSYFPYARGPKPAEQNLPNRPNCIFLDNAGCIYCGGWDKSLRRYNPAAARWESFQLYGATHFILPKNDRELWLGTELGIAVFDKTTFRAQTWEHDERNPDAILPNRKVCGCVRRNGAVWFGGAGGASCIDPALQSFPQNHGLPPEEYCSAIYKDTLAGRTFWGTSFGESGRVTMFCAEGSTPPRIAFRRSGADYFENRFLFRDPFVDFYWLGTDKGLFKMDARSFRLTALHDQVFRENTGQNQPPLPLKNKLAPAKNLTLHDVAFRCATLDQQGNPWLGTYYYGVLRFDRRTQKFSQWNLRGAARTDDNFVRNLYCDRAGRIWAGLVDFEGLAIFDPAQNRDLLVDTTKIWAENFKGQGVYGFAEDSAGTVWVASTAGLLRCGISPTGDFWAERVPEIRMAVLFVAPDASGKLWLKTNSGVLRFDPRTRQSRVFNEKTGLTADFSFGRMFKTDDGEFFYGENYRWHPADIAPDETALPQVTITAVHLFDKPISAEKWAAPGSVLQLNHDENALFFDFSALNMNQPRDCRYHWQLRGNDPSRQISGAWGEHRATFTNLPPGEYQFEVWAETTSSNVQRPKSTFLVFRIAPPFWATWWFRTFAAACLLGLVFLFYKNRLAIATAAAKMRQQRAEIRQKEAEISQQEAESKRGLAEMEISALRAQMNPHFFFNSLSTLESFIVEQKTAEATAQLQKFSRLTRLVLENSARPLVPLEDDLAALRLYVELEQTRFQNSFRVDWDLDAGLLDENPPVPPLLVQPFVENAILHGLRNKKSGDKWLKISLRRVGETLVFNIEDNGVGREQARGFSSQKMRGQTSLGGKLTERRIELFNQTRAQKASVETQDLVDNQADTGTQVQLCLPLG